MEAFLGIIIGVLVSLGVVTYFKSIKKAVSQLTICIAIRKN